jgi:hypothetical protein
MFNWSEIKFCCPAFNSSWLNLYFPKLHRIYFTQSGADVKYPAFFSTSIQSILFRNRISSESATLKYFYIVAVPK